MAEKQCIRKVVPGIPMDDKHMAEHQKAFSDIEECIEYLDKQQSSLLTKRKKCDTIKSTKQTKEKPKCVNSLSTRKKRSSR